MSIRLLAGISFTSGAAKPCSSANACKVSRSRSPHEAFCDRKEPSKRTLLSGLATPPTLNGP
eukprot:CAMPEP_0118946580 /NCGR_PEP_ID=MMETSP1169-20130426/44450_1 /TAXON_ID=36882 /ORGANISM="Pyramimonas obovata, Strain CCMP722" /LENGTH=61 /DNA_ID=CAMNT_0006892585 /DNA_START=482 /DNA_END=667 /DNA_ORIENTATION=+